MEEEQTAFCSVSEVRKPAFPWILLEIQCPKNKVPLSPKLNPDGFYPLVTEVILDNPFRFLLNCKRLPPSFSSFLVSFPLPNQKCDC